MARLRDSDAVAFRHDVFRDLEDDRLRDGVEGFARRMRDVSRRMAQAGRLRNRYQQEGWFLEALDGYGEGVTGLVATLEAGQLRSAGLSRVREALKQYAGSASFIALRADTRRVRELLAEVRYCLTITGGRVKVTRYDGEADYGAEVLDAFGKFKQYEAEDHRAGFHEFVEMNHVEEAVLDRVALLYPEVFAELDAYRVRYADAVDPLVRTFDREVQFYLSYREFVLPLAAAGLPFCYPQVSERSKSIAGRDVFDIALAAKLVEAGTPVVPNDFRLDGAERVLVVSGPNQGGKTTFARAFGQRHHLAALGCPVPGRKAQLFLCDELFTHFEHGENLHDLAGKLQDDRVRMHAILERATGDSVVVLNELFTSTTLRDAVDLGTRVLRRIVDRDLLCVCVTFVDELADLGESTVSMVAAVVPDRPEQRTFRIVRRPADGLSYAMSVAAAYGIGYEQLTHRIGGRPPSEAGDRPAGGRPS